MYCIKNNCLSFSFVRAKKVGQKSDKGGKNLAKSQKKAGTLKKVVSLSLTLSISSAKKSVDQKLEKGGNKSAKSRKKSAKSKKRRENSKIFLSIIGQNLKKRQAQNTCT